MITAEAPAAGSACLRIHGFAVWGETIDEVKAKLPKLLANLERACGELRELTTEMEAKNVLEDH